MSKLLPIKKRYAIPIVIAIYLAVAIPTALIFGDPQRVHATLGVMLMNMIWAQVCAGIFFVLAAP